MNNMITVSAPGKLLLFGEHSAVYGYPCIVTAVNQRMKASVEMLNVPEFILEAPDVKVTGYRKQMSEVGKGEIPKSAQFVEIAAKNFTEKYPMKGGIHVKTKCEFSSQFGFGSSSASTVCVMKALSELKGIKFSRKELFDLCYQTVLDIQKIGSGFDVAAALYGGTMVFVKGGELIEPLQVNDFPLVVGYSGVKADTVSLVNDVKKKYDREPEKVKRIFEAITKIVDEVKEKMKEGDWERAGTLMNFNQEYLRDLGVSTEKLEAMISAAKKADAWGAKLSGAGGGDCMIALTPNDKKKAVADAIKKAGGQVIDVSVNAEGVRVEHF